MILAFPRLIFGVEQKLRLKLTQIVAGPWNLLCLDFSFSSSLISQSYKKENVEIFPVLINWSSNFQVKVVRSPDDVLKRLTKVKKWGGNGASTPFYTVSTGVRRIR